jgi:hypothetical protein
MRQMNSRNPQAAAANPQMQAMQKFFPIIFGFIYLKVPAGATIYMVVSSAMRIGTQEIMFKTGMVTPVAVEREIGSGKQDKAKPGATQAQRAKKGRSETGTTESTPAPKPAQGKSTATDGTSTAKRTLPPAKGGSSSNGRSGTNGRRNGSRRLASNGEATADDATPAPKQHPRSRSKRTRKAR